MRLLPALLTATALLASLASAAATACAALPPLPPFPALPATQAIDSVPMADSKNAAEVKLNLPIASGPYAPTWESIEKNYPGTPAWLRDAKFGIWVHFGPQAAGQSGDWYARNLYKQGSIAYKNHLRDYGHPSVSGYKEVLRDWNPTKLDPSALVALYKEAGARFLMIQGVHHDNFDMWDSRYQPWNSTRLGPKRDLLGEWTKAARAAGIRFGVTFHHEYNWWWWQTSFGSDNKDGPKPGVPYDGKLTLADSKGKWWEGLDPRLLYGVDLREYKGVVAAANHPWNPPPDGLFQNHAAYAKWYATWWALRMMDVVDKYSPDFIYTDGTNTQPFSGAGTGTGLKADAMQTVIADFYNQTLQRRGKVDVFSIVKFRPKTNGTVNTEEGGIPRGIKIDQPWIAETPVGDWFYAPGFTNDSSAVIRYLLEEVARDGNVCICIAPHPDGSLDDSTVKMLKETGQWMRLNGDGIYGSKAWTRLGEGADGKLNVLPGGKISRRQADHRFAPSDIRFTAGKDGNLYAYCMTVPATGTALRITSLGTTANLAGKPVKSVTLLGYTGSLTWKQEADALVVTLPDTSTFKTALGFKIETK
ncbi:MAG: alpha-L-fucosidase [Chthoniobacterales bacterium]